MAFDFRLLWASIKYVGMTLTLTLTLVPSTFLLMCSRMGRLTKEPLSSFKHYLDPMELALLQDFQQTWTHGEKRGLLGP